MISITACNAATPPAKPASPIPPAKTASPIQTLESNPTSAPSLTPAGNADMIFTNGTIITMDDGNSRAEALAIRGDNIIAVGTNGEVVKHRGANTILVNLDGKTLVPGFTDSHSHRVLNACEFVPRGTGPGGHPCQGLDTNLGNAIMQGWTSLSEMYTPPEQMDKYITLAKQGRFHSRINLYPGANGGYGEDLGSWYKAYRQDQVFSSRLRISGLKVFTGIDNDTRLLWTQKELNALLLARHQEGWHLAIKTVSTESLEMILIALENLEKTDPNIVNRRVRLEHALFLTPDQIARAKHLGLVPSIQTNMPGELVGEQDIAELVARQPPGSAFPWRNLVSADIVIAGGSAFPSYYVDEPTGAPFGSPVRLIYQAVTRVGNLGTQPEAWMLDQTITAEQALRALTINAAYATFEESVKGSLTPGKLADMVILSDNPLTVTPEQINNIQVLMTMIGGKVEYCLAGYKSLCPAASSAQPVPAPVTQISYPSATASASLPDSPPSNAIDGNFETIWGAGSHPEQWIQIDLGQPKTISAIRLIISQYPAGETIHQIRVGSDANKLTLIHEFKGFTADPNILEFKPSSPLKDIRYIKIVTTKSPSWVAWREIEIITPPNR